MIDPAVIDTINHAVAFRPPAIIHSVHDTSDVDAYRRTMLAQIAALERDVVAWIEKGSAAKERLWSALASEPVGEREIAMIESSIQVIEQRVEADAREYRRFEAAFDRELLSLGATLPDLVDAEREINGRILDVMAQEFSARAEFGTFFRAARAEFGSGGKDGPVFANPHDLEAFLKPLLS